MQRREVTGCSSPPGFVSGLASASTVYHPSPIRSLLSHFPLPAPFSLASLLSKLHFPFVLSSLLHSCVLCCLVPPCAVDLFFLVVLLLLVHHVLDSVKNITRISYILQSPTLRRRRLESRQLKQRRKRETKREKEEGKGSARW